MYITTIVAISIREILTDLNNNEFINSDMI